MNLDYSFFKVDDGQSLAYKKWDNVTDPRGVVVIIHGMAEHIERYDSLANYLNENGLIVYGTDQRGHGKTSGKKGLFSYNKGFRRVVKDQKQFFDYVKGENPNLKINYITHSMGSFIGRALISEEAVDVNKIILSGTGYEGRIKAAGVILLSSLICKVRGQGEDGVFLDGQVNNPLAASVSNPTTSFDWLTRDHNEVAKYINDSNCGFVCTNQFFNDFFKIINLVCKTSNIKKINPELPILLYSGDHDPVGGNNASKVKKLFEIYKKVGLNVEMKLNVGGRHENINETNRDQVFKEFLEFLLR